MKPYGYVRKDGEGLFIYGEHQFQNTMSAELVPVYLHPKEWVGLTDEEIKALASWWPSYDQMPALMVLAKDIQNSLKEKNNG